MTIPGLSLFYAGLVRRKNVLSVLMQCFAITCLVSILWLIVGYSLAFDAGNQFIGGVSKFLFNGVSESSTTGDIPESALFQLTFAIITVALSVGGFAERMKFSAVLLFSTLWVLGVYAPICHWVWGGGWLGEMGPVHCVGGILGTLLTGFFASNALGIFSGQEDIVIADQLGIQAIGVMATLGYTVVVTFVVLKIVDMVVGIRVEEDQEVEGLDLVLHDERGYDL